MTYQKYDTEQIKRSHNIIDVIGQAIRLKKSGKNHMACCPFHSEKTPSFTVDESKQFYYCFGCGAQGDVIKFVMEYQGVEFFDACQILGGALELMPSEQIKRNIEKAKTMPSYSVPIDDKRNPIDSPAFLYECKQLNELIYEKDGQHYMPMIDHFGELVNVAKINDPVSFFAGGISYGAFSFIDKQSDKNIAVVDPFLGMKLAKKFNHANILICFTDANLKYVCNYAKPNDKLVKPLVTDESDSICLDCDYLILNDEFKLERRGMRDE